MNRTLCPFCTGQTKVNNSWTNSLGIVRKLECRKCHHKMTEQTHIIKQVGVGILNEGKFVELPEGTLLFLTKHSVAERLKEAHNIEGQIVTVKISYEARSLSLPREKTK